MTFRHQICLLTLLATIAGCNDNAGFLTPSASDSTSSAESSPEPEQSGTDSGTENKDDQDTGTDEPAWVNSMYLTCSWLAIESETNLSFGCSVSSADETVDLKNLVASTQWKILAADNSLLSEGVNQNLENLFVLARQSFAGIKSDLTLQLKSGQTVSKTASIELYGLGADGTLAACLNSSTALTACFDQAGVPIENKTPPPETEQAWSPATDNSGMLTVTGILLNGTGWKKDAVPVPAGSGSEQLRTIPQTDINQIVIFFSKITLISQDKFQVQGVRVKDYPITTYTLQDNKVTLTLGQSIIDDKIRLHISSAGTDIDGEWNNPGVFEATGSSAFPSGNGKNGGSFDFRFNALRGDASNTNAVNNGRLSAIDSLAIINSINSGTYVRNYDLDSNGVVDQADAEFVTNRINSDQELALPVREP